MPFHQMTSAIVFERINAQKYDVVASERSPASEAISQGSETPVYVGIASG